MRRRSTGAGKSATTKIVAASHLLFDLGTLQPLIVVARPSKTIKTAYVADCLPRTDEIRSLLATQMDQRNGRSPPASSTKKDKEREKNALHEMLSSQGETVLAHTPALDCAGMIVPGSTVWCTENGAERNTKTAFTVQHVGEVRGNGVDDGDLVTVGCHPNQAERAAKRLLELSLLPEVGLYNLTTIASQQTFGNSRVDYVLSSSDEGSMTLVEVKNVVGADYQECMVPVGRSEVGVYTQPAVAPSGLPYRRHAIFPHGSQKPGMGVVSDRAIKHVHELTTLHRTTDIATGRRISCVILFMINRSDCEAFRPCHEACPLFAQMLLRAQKAGVQLLAKELVWEGGACRAGRLLPVVFHPSVDDTNIDEDHLQRVLEFNEQGSGRKTPPSKTPPKKPNISPKASPPKRKGGEGPPEEEKTTPSPKKRRSARASSDLT